jgi:hypothetical protein
MQKCFSVGLKFIYKCKSNLLTLIETRKSGDLQSDDYY